MGTAEEGDQEEMKRMILETNPYLLGTTMIVTLLHTIFDFLAFKNDIQFWNNKKNVEGLSIRTLFVNFFMQVVIFLYLLDNDTSWMILISSFVGLVIEVWKIKNAVEFKVNFNFLFFFFSNINYKYNRELINFHLFHLMIKKVIQIQKQKNMMN